MFRIFGNLKKKEWGLAALCVGFIVLQVWLELKLPDYMKDITGLISMHGSEMKDVLAAGGKMLLCAFGSLITAVFTSVCASKIASNFSAYTRKRLFDKVQSFSMEEMGRFSTASLITRSTNDVTQVQMLIVLGLQVILRAPIMAGMAIGKIADKNSAWTLTTGIAVLLLLTVITVCISLALPKFKKLQRLTDDLNRVTRENLTGLSVVRAFNAEDYQQKKFEAVNTEFTNTHLFTSSIMSFMLPSITLIMNGLALSIYWIGAWLIDKADMMDKGNLFSDMVVFSSYAMQVVMSFMMLVMIFIIFPRASVAAKRILEVTNTEPSVTDGTKTDGLPEARGKVEFSHVCFRYPDAEDNVLTDISFTAEPGETVAIIGSTGCGKSTAVNLIPRFYDATQGEVFVDGINVKEYTQKSLRNRIGYVSQRAILFSGNVKDNIAYGDNGAGDISLDTVKKAIACAQATEFIETPDMGYEGHVSQGGNNFSGGQKQRLSIARAVARKPEILIFDDSFSALDYKTDRILRKALKETCADATKIIVAQRIGTIRDADKIIVLEDGEIAGMGKHDELMQNCEVYKEIALSQLSKEEL